MSRMVFFLLEIVACRDSSNDFTKFGLIVIYHLKNMQCFAVKLYVYITESPKKVQGVICAVL